MKNDLGIQFVEGLTGAIVDIIKLQNQISLHRLIKLNNRIIEDISKDERFSVVCRLFETGLRYMQTKDNLVLFTTIFFPSLDGWQRRDDRCNCMLKIVR